MAAVSSARLVISLVASTVPASPVAGELTASLENGSGGARWTDGQASGMIDRAYRVEGTLAAAAVDTYDVLAAGSLRDINGAVIDLDEIKGLVLKCNTGSIKFLAPAANFLTFFGATGDYINLTAGQMIAVDFATAGTLLTTNSKFNVVDSFGGSGSTYSLMFIGSN